MSVPGKAEQTVPRRVSIQAIAKTCRNGTALKRGREWFWSAESSPTFTAKAEFKFSYFLSFGGGRK